MKSIRKGNKNKMIKNHIGFQEREGENGLIVNPHSCGETNEEPKTIEHKFKPEERYVGFQQVPYYPTIPVITSTIGYQSESREEHGIVVPYSTELWEKTLAEHKNPHKDIKTPEVK